jgi:hypothetical protein
MSEAWFRNPHNYIRELVEVGVSTIVWDRGALIKRRIDPVVHATLHYGAQPFRLLLVGQQGAAELTPGRSLARPKAVYPVWTYGEETAILEEIVTQPVGADPSVCAPGLAAPDETPVLGQEHRVIVSEFPASGTGPGRQFLRYLKELQEDHPECIIHLHGVYSWRVAFGLGFRAADIDPRYDAQKGKVVLPAGGSMTYEQASRNPKWITALGYKPVDLKEPRNRCMFNIKSANWAAEHYVNLHALPTATTKRRTVVDTETPDALVKTPTGKIPLPVAALPTDKHLCNTCSVSTSCSFYRAGAVCSVPGAEPKELAEYFQTRDSETIIDGLATLLGAQARRLEQGVTEETIDGDLKPEVTKILNTLFDRGVALAKLVNPALRDPKLAINMGPNSQALILNGSTSQMTAALVRSLEQQGIPRDQITPDMISNALSALAAQKGNIPRAIEGTVIEHRDEKAG